MEPNVPALLEKLKGGDPSALPHLRDAAPPEAEGPAEEWIRRACANPQAYDDSAADAIALLRKLEASSAAPTIAKALAHPSAHVRDEAARALGEFRYYPAIGRLREARSDAALEALETMFQAKWYGGHWAELTGRPRRVNGKRDWSEFERWWNENEDAHPVPPLTPEECTADRPVAHFLDRLPGAHRVFERHGYRCVARVGRDIEECVAVTKDSIADAGRLHQKDHAPLLADLAALARKIASEEAPPAKVDEVETVG